MSDNKDYGVTLDMGAETEEVMKKGNQQVRIL